MTVQPTRIRPFLMFDGKAGEAMNYYVALFPGSEVTEVTRYGKGEAGGTELMPLGDYGFNRLLACINDRYGLSWQLNLD